MLNGMGRKIFLTNSLHPAKFDRVYSIVEIHRTSKVGINRYLGVQEHRVIYTVLIEFRRIGSRYLLTSSGWRNEIQASQERMK